MCPNTDTRNAEALPVNINVFHLDNNAPVIPASRSPSCSQLPTNSEIFTR
jgi:hypothetical protein